MVLVNHTFPTSIQTHDGFKVLDIAWQLDPGIAQRVIEMVQQESNVVTKYGFHLVSGR